MGTNGDGPNDEHAQAEPRLSMWKQAQMGYAELVNAIIRPPRMEYTVQDLGPNTLSLGTESANVGLFAHTLSLPRQTASP